MDRASPFTLSAGSPVLVPGEALVIMGQDVDLYDRDEKTSRLGGIVSFTTHRVLWMCAARRDTCAWALADVERAEAEAGGFFTSKAPKLVLRLRVGTHVKLSFKCNSAVAARDSCLSAVGDALSRRAWGAAVVPAPLAAAPVAGVPDAKRSRVEGGGGVATASDSTAAQLATHSSLLQEAPLTAPKPGLAGVAAVRDARLAREREVAATAFSDLSELGKHAKALVGDAKRYATELRRNRDTAAAAGGAAASEEDERMSALLADMGVVGTPITRALAGGLYLEELARQVGVFMLPRLTREGGFSPLTDVYCAYNRARGLDVVSPDDLLAACALLPRLHIGVTCRTLRGGLPVLALDSTSDDAVLARLLVLLGGRDGGSGGKLLPPPLLRALLPSFPPLPSAGASWAKDASISALDVSTAWGVPLAIAKQHLLLGEAEGVLARDVTPGGVRWCANRLAQVDCIRAS